MTHDTAALVDHLRDAHGWDRSTVTGAGHFRFGPEVMRFAARQHRAAHDPALRLEHSHPHGAAVRRATVLGVR